MDILQSELRIVVIKDSRPNKPGRFSQTLADLGFTARREFDGMDDQGGATLTSKRLEEIAQALETRSGSHPLAASIQILIEESSILHLPKSIRSS